MSDLPDRPRWHKDYETDDDKPISYIDEFRLDAEWAKQPGLVEMYSGYKADAREELASFEDDLEVAEAELSLDVRKRPDHYGFSSKPTDPTVKALVAADKEIRKIRARIIKVKHEIDLLTGILSALDSRKSALGDLVDLLAMNYNSTPIAGAGNKEAVRESRKKRAREKARMS